MREGRKELYEGYYGSFLSFLTADICNTPLRGAFLMLIPMPTVMRNMVCTLLVGIFCLASLCITATVGAHDVPDTTAHTKHVVQERTHYEQCLKKAANQSKTARAASEKACRKAYASTRLMEPVDLLHIFHEHPHAAEDSYTGFLLGVRGTIHRITKNALGYPEIIFAADAFGMSGVRCVLPQSAAHTVARLKEGETITVGGICKGLERDSYVLLEHVEIYE